MNEILQDLQAFLQDLLSKAPSGPLNCLLSKLLNGIGSALEASTDSPGNLDTINDGLSKLVGGSGGFLEMLIKELQQAIDDGDTDEAQRLLRLIQTLLGQIQENTSSEDTKGDIQKILDSLGPTVEGLLGSGDPKKSGGLLDSIGDTLSDVGKDLFGNGKLIFEKEREKLRFN